MKTRRTIIMILTLCVALSFTACTGKGDVGNGKDRRFAGETG